MESNKILISAKFLLKGGNDISIELMILRDATLGELCDSIKYGLRKRAKHEKADGVFKKCSEIFGNCLQEKKTVGNKEYWTLIGLSIYDRKTLEKDRDSCFVKDVGSAAERVYLFTSAVDKKLCDLGIISATSLLFFEDESEYGKETTELDLKEIPTPFKSDAETDYPIDDIKFPKYNISSRQLTRYDTTAVEVIPPQAPPTKPKQGVVQVLLPTLLSMGMMMLLQSPLVKGQSSGNGSWAFMSIGMGLVSMITAMISLIRQRKEYQKSLESWRENYQNYIARLIKEIKARQERDAIQLAEDYPEWGVLKKSLYSLSGDLFNRSPANADFLTVSLGSSDHVENLFKIEGKAKDEVFSPAFFVFDNDNVLINLAEEKDDVGITENQNESPNSYLSNIPAHIARQYRYMKGAPYIYSFRNTGTLGIECNGYSKIFDDIGDRFIRTLIFKLCYHHSPENLQFVIFFPETTDSNDIYKRIKKYSYLPHCRELLENKSQFVFSSAAANSVLSSMLKIMEGREKTATDGDTPVTPHIVFIVFDEYDLKEHAFAKYIPTAPVDGNPYKNKLGLSFIFVKDYKQFLPEYCTDIISFKNDGEIGATKPGSRPSLDPCDATLVSYTDKNNRIQIKCNIMPGNDEAVQIALFSFLSSMYYTRISQNRQVPSNVSLFDLLHSKASDIKQSILANWADLEEDGKKTRRFDVTKTLAVPIGDTGGKDPTFLDLHERSDGPHMLVAGTTGSGKSETIISYLIGLCMRYRPDEVNLMLVDMKGGGFTKRLGILPHVVGKVTDIDGDENNTGAEYMLKRFLVAIKDEIKHRKLVINHFDGVDSLDGYIKRCRKINADPNASAEDKQYVAENTMSHLILVVDEFTELKRFSSQSDSIDYMGEITTIARIGRSLGIHIILISQNIEGAINDDIRVNAKSRLCLKVATRQASNEMLGNDLAAAPSMPGNGRAYLLVGTGSKFEYFQSAYSGASSAEKTAADLSVTYVKKEGEYEIFYHAYEDNDEIIKAREKGEETQLEVAVKAICECYSEKKDEIRVRKIFRDPLPSAIVYKKEED